MNIKTITRVIYKTEDGAEFSDPNNAITHQRFLQVKDVIGDIDHYNNDKEKISMVIARFDQIQKAMEVKIDPLVKNND